MNNMTDVDINTKEGMEFAVNWTTTMFSVMRDGSMWGIPRSFAIYTIYPSKKVAVRIHPDDAVDRVIQEMGWEIREEI